MDIKIGNRLSTLNLSTRLEEVNKVLNTDPKIADLPLARSDVTFWGTRVVKVAGIEGSVSLDELALKTHRAACQRTDADDLTPAERIAGIEIVKKLQQFYEDTDKQIGHLNFFTRFFVWIREFSFVPYTPRFYIEGCTEGDFRVYSREKLIQAFGKRALNGHSNEHKITVDEKQIRNLLKPRFRIPALFRA